MEAMTSNLLFVTHPSRFLQSHLRRGSFHHVSFSSLLVMGSLAIQAVLSLPDPSRVKERHAEILKRSVDSFIATESPIALAVGYLPSLKVPQDYVIESSSKYPENSGIFNILNEQH